jgi:DNA-binding protein HU-beta
MTKTDLIAQVAANTEMSKKSAELAVNAAFEALGKAMAEGEKITIIANGPDEEDAVSAIDKYISKQQ